MTREETRAAQPHLRELRHRRQHTHGRLDDHSHQRQHFHHQSPTKSSPSPAATLDLGACRGLGPEQQFSQAGRRGRQLRERRRVDAQLAERAREPGRGLRGARHRRAGGGRRGGQTKQRRCHQAPRTCQSGALHQAPPPLRARRLAEPTTRPASKWQNHRAVEPSAPATGSGLVGVTRPAARPRGRLSPVTELLCPRGASVRPCGPRHGLWQRRAAARSRQRLSNGKMAPTQERRCNRRAQRTLPALPSPPSSRRLESSKAGQLHED